MSTAETGWLWYWSIVKVMVGVLVYNRIMVRVLVYNRIMVRVLVYSRLWLGGTGIQ